MGKEKHWTQEYWHSVGSTGRKGISGKRIKEVTSRIRRDFKVSIQVSSAILPKIMHLEDSGKLGTHILVSWNTPDHVTEEIAFDHLYERVRELQNGDQPVRYEPRFVLDLTRGIRRVKMVKRDA